MKKIVLLFLLGLFSACQSKNPKEIQEDVVSVEVESESVKKRDYPNNIIELERLESEEPLNAEIKLLLGRHYYCASRTSLALENWAWVNRFAVEEELKKQASVYLNSSDLKNLAACEKLQ